MTCTDLDLTSPIGICVMAIQSLSPVVILSTSREGARVLVPKAPRWTQQQGAATPEWCLAPSCRIALSCWRAMAMSHCRGKSWRGITSTTRRNGVCSGPLLSLAGLSCQFSVRQLVPFVNWLNITKEQLRFTDAVFEEDWPLTASLRLPVSVRRYLSAPCVLLKQFSQHEQDRASAMESPWWWKQPQRAGMPVWCPTPSQLCGCASRASSCVRMRCLYHQKGLSHDQAHSLHDKDWVATALMLLLCKVGSDGSKCWEECWLVMPSFVEVCMRCIGLMSRPVPFGDGTELPLLWLTAIAYKVGRDGSRAGKDTGWSGGASRKPVWDGLVSRSGPFHLWCGWDWSATSLTTHCYPARPGG